MIFDQVAFAGGVEFYTLRFEDLLLQIHRDGEAAGGAFALGVDDPLPRYIIARTVQHIADGAGGVAFAEETSDLPVGHHAARGNLADELVNAFAVVFIVSDVQSSPVRIVAALTLFTIRFSLFSIPNKSLQAGPSE